MRQRLLKIRALRVIRHGILGDLSGDRLGRCARGGYRFYRRLLIRNLIGYTMIVTVHDGSLLRFRRRAKGIFERSDERRLLRGCRRRVRCCDGGSGGDGARVRSVRRCNYRDRTG